MRNIRIAKHSAISVFLVSLYLGFSPRPARAEEPTAARVPPFFWYESDPANDQKFLMAMLLYWSVKDRQEKFELFAPFYYNSQTPDEKIRVLLPFHFKYDSKDTDYVLWGPYFSKKSLRSQTKFVFPLYFNTETDNTRTTFLGLYLGLSNPKFDSNLFFPLYWSYRPRSADQRSYQTLFPFYLRTAKGVSRTWISPLFFSYRDEKVSQGFVPPYYWRHSANAKTQVGFPLYWRFLRRDEEKTKDIQIAVPWFKVSFPSSTFRGFVPLYFGRTKIEPDPSSTTFRTSSWNIVLPFLAHVQEPDGTMRLVSPLFSRFRTPDGQVFGHSGLNFFSYDPWGGKTEGFFPLFYYRYEPDFYRFRFLTLYLKRTNDNQHYHFSIFPLFRYKRDTDRNQFLTLVSYNDHDPERDRGYLLTYFWKTDYQMEGQSRVPIVRKRFFVPLAWFYKSEDQQTTVFPPLVAFHKEDNFRFSMIAPFYFQRQKGEDRLTIIPPMIARKSPQRAWFGFLFLFWQSADQNRHAITLLPLFRKSNFPTGSSLYLPGFYRLKEGKETQGVALNYLWDHRGATQYNMFVPLYVNFKRPTWSIRTLIPVYAFENEWIREKGFFPFWAVTKPNWQERRRREQAAKPCDCDVSSQTAVGLPLPQTDLAKSLRQSEETESGEPAKTGAPAAPEAKHFLADSHRVLPFYFYRDLENGYDLWLPVLLGRINKETDREGQKSIRGRMLLLSYWERTPKYFVNRFDPLFVYERSPRRKGFSAPTAPFPLWRYQVDNPDSPDERQVMGAFFPYYWRSSKTFRRDFVLPVYYHRRELSEDGKEETSRVTWLLAYFHSENKSEMRAKTFFVPLYWSLRNKDERRTIFFPVWSDRGANFRRDIVFPLWWNFQRDGEQLSFLFPLYMRSRDRTTGRKTTLFPGFWRSQDPEGSTLLVLNYYQRTSDREEQARVFFPLFWSLSSRDRSAVTVFPLYWNMRSGSRGITYFFPLYFSHRAEDFKWRIAFPIFWSFDKGQTQVRVVPPYFSIYSRATKEKTTGIAPLWTYTHDASGRHKNFQVFGGLFGYEKRDDRGTITLLYLLKI